MGWLGSAGAEEHELPMTLLENPWFELSSLRLSDSGWEHVRSAVDFESASNGQAVLR